MIASITSAWNWVLDLWDTGNWYIRWAMLITATIAILAPIVLIVAAVYPALWAVGTIDAAMIAAVAAFMSWRRWYPIRHPLGGHPQPGADRYFTIASAATIIAAWGATILIAALLDARPTASTAIGTLIAVIAGGVFVLWAKVDPGVAYILNMTPQARQLRNLAAIAAAFYFGTAAIFAVVPVEGQAKLVSVAIIMAIALAFIVRLIGYRGRAFAYISFFAGVAVMAGIFIFLVLSAISPLFPRATGTVGEVRNGLDEGLTCFLGNRESCPAIERPSRAAQQPQPAQQSAAPQPPAQVQPYATTAPQPTSAPVAYPVTNPVRAATAFFGGRRPVDLPGGNTWVTVSLYGASYERSDNTGRCYELEYNGYVFMDCPGTSFILPDEVTRSSPKSIGLRAKEPTRVWLTVK